MPEKYKKLLQREDHGAATFTVNSDCVEVILFGGYDKHGSLMADPTILRFGVLVKVKYGNFLIAVKTCERSFLFSVSGAFVLSFFNILLMKLLLLQLLSVLSMLCFIVRFPIFQL